MAGKKTFNTQDLVLKINPSSYNPIMYPLDDWERFLDVLCGNRIYQKEAIKTAIIYLISSQYNTIEDLVRDNYHKNDQLQIRYNTEQEYLAKIQIPNKLSACIDLATGTGKSYVMYGIAQIALGLGIVDKILVLGPPSLTIEKELMMKFTTLATDINLINSIPESSKSINPSIISADKTIKDGDLCIENINAVYSKTGSSIFDSLAFGKGERCLVLNDEVHHAYNKVEGRSIESQSVKKWREFILDSTYSFKYVLGFTGTSYVEDEYFNDVIYRYSLRTAIEDKYVKTINYIIENEDNSEDERFQKILHNHKRNKFLYAKVKPLTILITKDIKFAKQLKTRLVEFLVEKGEGSEEYISTEKVLIVTSDKDHKANVLKLPLVDNIEEPVEWIISVAMLTEGWDVKNVFQIVPMEERAFNSKLLISQVLGRGLRVPPSYPDAEVVVFNHDKWSKNIKDLVDEILEMETRVRNSPLIEGERSKYHFKLYNINYKKEKVEREISRDTETFNYKDYIEFAAETFEHKTEVKYVKIGDKEYSLPYEIEKEKFHITNEIVNKIYEEFQMRKLEGIILKMDEKEYTSENLPNKDAIESIIRRSMKRRGLEGDYLGKRNRQAVFTAFNTLLRKRPKSVQLVKTSDLIFEINTIKREHESISLLALKNDSTIFFTSEYVDEIVISDSLIGLKEIIKETDDLPGRALRCNINPFLFKTPIDMVFTTAKPERDFVGLLIEKENASIVTAWIKSKNQNFYSLEYSYTKGTHTTTHLFNPDFFLMYKEGTMEYISVVEIKSDGDNSDENKQKYKYALEHFSELNKQLKDSGIPQYYFFNFLTPKNYPAYFSYFRNKKLFDGKFKSELDILLEE